MLRVGTLPVLFGFGSPRTAIFRTGRYSLRRGGEIGTALRRSVQTNTGQYCYQVVLLVQDAALAASSVGLCTHHYNKVPSSTRSVGQFSVVPFITADPTGVHGRHSNLCQNFGRTRPAGPPKGCR